MATLFSKIVLGEIPCFKVAESDDFLAFLDIQPLAIGHVLVIPKIEVDYLFDIDDDLLAKMIIFSKDVANKIKQVISCKKVGVAVIGLEVPHAHIHLVPINSISDMNFSSPKLSIESHDLESIANKIARV